MPHPFEPLKTICKNRFPFTLACPSFVYPAGYVDNVRRLAPFLDEIELLFFESRFADSLPSRELVRELAQLGRSGDITYNVHLPTDIYLGHRESQVRQTAAKVLQAFIDRCQLLDPTTFTLHLIRDASEPDPGHWQRHLEESLQEVLTTGLPGRRLCVENLDYDFSLAAPVVNALDLSVCMDMGHLMLHGLDIVDFYEYWRDRIAVAHLHGVAGPRDHLSLERLAPDQMDKVLKVLQRFNKVVSLEVFSFSALSASVALLKDRWGMEDG